MPSLFKQNVSIEVINTFANIEYGIIGAGIMISIFDIQAAILIIKVTTLCLVTALLCVFYIQSEEKIKKEDEIAWMTENSHND